MTEKQKTCQICHEQITDEIDAVVCPVCGAGYHRDCFEKLGKCVYEDAHGTDLQYNPDDTASENADNGSEPFDPFDDTVADNTKCSRCGHVFEEDEKFCPYCRTPRGIAFNPQQVFEAFSGFADDFEKDGVKAVDVKAFTMANSNRYLKKFFSLGKDNRLSWNWAAFLVPEGWFFYRKMSRWGFIAMILKAIAAVFFSPMLLQWALQESETVSMELFISFLSGLDKTTYILGVVGCILSLLISILAGVFGDYIYCNHIKDRILNIEKIDNPVLADVPRPVKLSRIGGINPFMFLVGFCIVQFVPDIVNYLIH